MKIALKSVTQDPQLEPYIVSLIAERDLADAYTLPSSDEGPSRRLHATFAQLMAGFEQFATRTESHAGNLPRPRTQGAKKPQQRGKPKPTRINPVG